MVPFLPPEHTPSDVADQLSAMTILMADNDAEDRQFTREAFEASRLANDFRPVKDGVELLDYLHRRGPYAKDGAAPRPRIMLLELNMPRMGGLEALERIKGDPSLARIPVIVPTTSAVELPPAADRRT